MSRSEASAGRAGGAPADGVAVRVRLFGVFRELARKAEWETVLPAGSTTADLVAGLRGEGLDFLPERPTVAVNREYASPERRLEPGDEVALIPPVAGGRA